MNQNEQNVQNELMENLVRNAHLNTLQEEGSINPQVLKKFFVDPDKISNVITQVKLNKGELVSEDDHYYTMWNMFFVDRTFFAHKDNFQLLSALFPAFAIVKMTSPFRHIHAESEERKAKIDELSSMFETNYLILPFKTVKNSGIYYGWHIEFVGAKFNKTTTTRAGYSLCYSNVTLLTISAYGFYYNQNFTSLQYMTVPSLAFVSGERTLAQSFLKNSELIPTRVIDVMLACESTILFGEKEEETIDEN